jgi:Kef-type K+ transport system membrane component KefB
MFGGFLAGMAMRAGSRDPDEEVLRSIEHVSGVLLPLFFVVTGLSLDIGAMRKDAFVLLAVILIVAVMGKLGPAYAVSRLCGLRPSESATVATLVNTRGLTELVALNVGLAAGLIDQQLFTILVLMALITTLLTGPLLHLLSLHGSEISSVQRDNGIIASVSLETRNSGRERSDGALSTALYVTINSALRTDEVFAEEA